jgi:predicted AAA+ superfamily ATPase
VTGSNAKMMDDDLHNEFGGRWMEIKMLPLSFKEYADGIKDYDGASLQSIYSRYVTESGFPQTVEFSGKTQLIHDYLLNTIYSKTVQRDIVRKYKIPDSNKLDDTVRFLFDNIGSETSLLNIETGLKKSGRKVDADTIGNYVKWLQDSFLVYKCERYDIRGKKLLSTNAKYYVVDAGLRYALLGHTDRDLGKTLENVVYLELLRRGYKVYVGKIGKKQIIENEEVSLEVDFVAERNGDKEYYQVTQSIENEKVMKREYASLNAIDDHYQKYVLSMDAGTGGENGIKRINVLDWLLAE